MKGRGTNKLCVEPGKGRDVAAKFVSREMVVNEVSEPVILNGSLALLSPQTG